MSEKPWPLCPQRDRHVNYTGCAECGWIPQGYRALYVVLARRDARIRDLEARVKELEADLKIQIGLKEERDLQMSRLLLRLSESEARAEKAEAALAEHHAAGSWFCSICRRAAERDAELERHQHGNTNAHCDYCGFNERDRKMVEPFEIQREGGRETRSDAAGGSCERCDGSGVVISGSEARPNSILPRPCPVCSAARDPELDTGDSPAMRRAADRMARRSAENQECGT